MLHDAPSGRWRRAGRAGARPWAHRGPGRDSLVLEADEPGDRAAPARGGLRGPPGARARRRGDGVGRVRAGGVREGLETLLDLHRRRWAGGWTCRPSPATRAGAGCTATALPAAAAFGHGAPGRGARGRGARVRGRGVRRRRGGMLYRTATVPGAGAAGARRGRRSSRRSTRWSRRGPAAWTRDRPGGLQAQARSGADALDDHRGRAGARAWQPALTAVGRGASGGAHAGPRRASASRGAGASGPPLRTMSAARRRRPPSGTSVGSGSRGLNVSMRAGRSERSQPSKVVLAARARSSGRRAGPSADPRAAPRRGSRPARLGWQPGGVAVGDPGEVHPRRRDERVAAG